MERFFFALNGKAIYFEGLAGQILLHLRNENCARSHIGASRKASDEALADQEPCLKPSGESSPCCQSWEPAGADCRACQRIGRGRAAHSGFWRI